MYRCISYKLISKRVWHFSHCDKVAGPARRSCLLVHLCTLYTPIEKIRLFNCVLCTTYTLNSVQSVQVAPVLASRRRLISCFPISANLLIGIAASSLSLCKCVARGHHVMSNVTLHLQCRAPTDNAWHTLNTRVVHISDVPRNRSDLQVFSRAWSHQDFLAQHIFRIEVIVPRSH